MFFLRSITNLTNHWQDHQVSAAVCCVKKSTEKETEVTKESKQKVRGVRARR